MLLCFDNVSFLSLLWIILDPDTVGAFVTVAGIDQYFQVFRLRPLVTGFDWIGLRTFTDCLNAAEVITHYYVLSMNAYVSEFLSVCIWYMYSVRMCVLSAVVRDDRRYIVLYKTRNNKT